MNRDQHLQIEGETVTETAARKGTWRIECRSKESYVLLTTITIDGNTMQAGDVFAVRRFLEKYFPGQIVAAFEEKT